ncbi:MULTISPECIES: hypothetical protein [unclassified Streptomyces]|uniref:hypothetical protein n=1 Tax=unclassified Streptomyces TaxID=2593676 RepID=UPI000DC7A6D1|nr:MULTISPECIES: hypothetical protein [unclassified Streptomyces]AWZ05925.1 hypothetical protein DRB89_16220 [Streptomyces sp. ICC4]AWZ12958.1 hypothetical protein DRB96_12180 [Streptomyces sp. ICC1]
MIFEDAKRSLERKLHVQEYRHTPLIDGYEDAEKLYKHFRAHLDMVSACLKSLTSYEFGGQFFRQVAEVPLLTADPETTALKREDMYTDIARVGTSLKAALPPGPLTATAAAF